MNRSASSLYFDARVHPGRVPLSVHVASCPGVREGPGRRPGAQGIGGVSRKSAKSAPPERIKRYEQGIEEVRKSGATEKALKVGDRAPDFELPDATGKKVKLSDLKARGPVVVTWYRGGWCPYCNIALRGFHKSLPEIRAAGASLVAISPETPDNSMSTTEKNHLDYEVLSDKGNKVATPTECLTRSPRSSRTSSRGDSTWPSTTAMTQANSLLAPPTSSTVKGSSASRSSTRTTARGPSPPT